MDRKLEERMKKGRLEEMTGKKKCHRKSLTKLYKQNALSTCIIKEGGKWAATGHCLEAVNPLLHDAYRTLMVIC